ncbi:hypothetical protein BN1708_010093, partial [Verticillium longisporum]
MSPSADDTPHNDRLPTQAQESKDSASSIVALIDQLSSHSSVQSLKAVIHGKEQLKKELESTRNAYVRNLEELALQRLRWDTEKTAFEAKAQEQGKQYNKVKDDKVTAYRKLRDEQDNAARLRSTIQSLEEEVKRAIAKNKKYEVRITDLERGMADQTEQLRDVQEKEATLKEELQSAKHNLLTQSEVLVRAEDSLASFRSFTATLIPLEDEISSISEMLDSAFSDALNLFKVSLGCDLHNDRLKESRSWDRVRDHPSVDRLIPLPASNSAHAKRMRTAAGLAIYARALSKHVFRQTYLTVNDSTERVLHTLQAANATQDVFVRAVLLKVLPEQQRQCQEECATHAVDEVLVAVGGWLSADQRATFKSRLGHLTSVLCGEWQRVQVLNERVEPCLSIKTPDDWLPLPTLGDPVAVDDGAGSRGRQTRQQDTHTELSASEMVKILWPAFLAFSPEQAAEEEEIPPVLIHHGYALTRVDVQGAAD